MEKIGVIIYGCGVMGRKIAHTVYSKKSFEIRGAVDTAPALVGKDLGELFPDKKKIGIIIEKDAEKVLSDKKAQAAVVAAETAGFSTTPSGAAGLAIALTEASERPLIILSEIALTGD